MVKKIEAFSVDPFFYYSAGNAYPADNPIGALPYGLLIHALANIQDQLWFLTYYAKYMFGNFNIPSGELDTLPYYNLVTPEVTRAIPTGLSVDVVTHATESITNIMEWIDVIRAEFSLPVWVWSSELQQDKFAIKADHIREIFLAMGGVYRPSYLNIPTVNPSALIYRLFQWSEEVGTYLYYESSFEVHIFNSDGGQSQRKIICCYLPSEEGPFLIHDSGKKDILLLKSEGLTIESGTPAISIHRLIKDNLVPFPSEINYPGMVIPDEWNNITGEEIANTGAITTTEYHAIDLSAGFAEDEKVEFIISLTGGFGRVDLEGVIYDEVTQGTFPDRDFWELALWQPGIVNPYT